MSTSPTKQQIKKPYYRQKYNASWENDEQFKGWLARSKKGMNLI